MRWRIAVCVCVFACVGVSCDMADDDAPEATVSAPELGADEFSLTGVVADAKEGAQPSGGIPGEDDLMSAEVGGIAIRPDGPVDAAGLDDCSTTQDAYVTYYTPATDASGLDDDDDFPESLEGTRVSVEGVRHERTDDADASPDASPDIAGTCILVLEEIEAADEASPVADDDDGTTGTTGGAGGTDDDGTAQSPRPTDEEGETVFESPADFPEHEDTDPIFEGTPSPDPCEGQKACEKKREEGEIP